MAGNKVTKQIIVTGQKNLDSNLIAEDCAFFTPSGQQLTLGVITATTATAAATAAKTTSTPAPPANSLIAVSFTSGNTVASPTINFNGAGAVNILLGGAAPASAEITLSANGVAMFFYDGTNLHQIGVYS
jgi:hypothetical protein